MHSIGGLFAIGFVASLVLGAGTMYLFLSKQIGIRQLIYWEGLSVGLLILSVFPGITDWLASLMGVGVRGLFVLTLGLLGAYTLSYNLLFRQYRIEKRIWELSQEIALLRYELEYGSEVQNERSDDNNGL